MQKYYPDTSIWLDLFEDRNEPNLAKGKYAKELFDFITKKNKVIVFSNIVQEELEDQGYFREELKHILKPFNKILIKVEYNDKQFTRAKDLASKRRVPLFDALHALIARDSQAILITRDHHFKFLSDIAKCKKPEEII